MTFRQRLARHLRLARRSARLTQVQLAERLGCNRRTVERIEGAHVQARDELIDAWELVTGATSLNVAPPGRQ